MPARLYLLPAPLSDTPEGFAHLPPAALKAAAECDCFLVENERTARRRLGAQGLGLPVRELTFFRLDKKTTEAEVSAAFERAPSGKPLAVMSEAGCPGVADPGAKAVALAHRRGVPVVPLSGPSAFLLALMASGMNGQSFAFSGYLPIDKAERKKALLRMETQALRHGQTQIFMETPYRNEALFKAMTEALSPETLLCVAADLTAPTETCLTLPVKEWRKRDPALGKRPAAFLIGKRA